MARAKEKVLSILSSTDLVDMDTNAKVDLYTVPTGKIAIVTMVVVRKLANATALGSNNDFGDGAQADTWKTDVDLSAMDAVDDYYVVTNNNTMVEAVFDAADVFGVSPDEDADSGGANTATIEVWGYEDDA